MMVLKKLTNDYTLLTRNVKMIRNVSAANNNVIVYHQSFCYLLLGCMHQYIGDFMPSPLVNKNALLLPELSFLENAPQTTELGLNVLTAIFIEYDV